MTNRRSRLHKRANSGSGRGKAHSARWRQATRHVCRRATARSSCRKPRPPLPDHTSGAFSPAHSFRTTPLGLSAPPIPSGPRLSGLSAPPIPSGPHLWGFQPRPFLPDHTSGAFSPAHSFRTTPLGLSAPPIPSGPHLWGFQPRPFLPDHTSGAFSPAHSFRTTPLGLSAPPIPSGPHLWSFQPRPFLPDHTSFRLPIRIQRRRQGNLLGRLAGLLGPGDERLTLASDVLSGASECDQHQPPRPPIEQLSPHAGATRTSSPWPRAVSSPSMISESSPSRTRYTSS